MLNKISLIQYRMSGSESEDKLPSVNLGKATITRRDLPPSAPHSHPRDLHSLTSTAIIIDYLSFLLETCEIGLWPARRKTTHHGREQQQQGQIHRQRIRPARSRPAILAEELCRRLRWLHPAAGSIHCNPIRRRALPPSIPTRRSAYPIPPCRGGTRARLYVSPHNPSVYFPGQRSQPTNPHNLQSGSSSTPPPSPSPCSCSGPPLSVPRRTNST